jgi:hypothetical protein
VAQLLLLRLQPRIRAADLLFLRGQALRLALRLGEQLALRLTRGGHLDRDRQAFAHRQQQLGLQRRPGLPARKLEHAGDLARVDQRQQGQRARQRLAQPGPDPRVVRRDILDHEQLGLGGRAPDQALTRSKAGRLAAVRGRRAEPMVA